MILKDGEFNVQSVNGPYYCPKCRSYWCYHAGGCLHCKERPMLVSWLDVLEVGGIFFQYSEGK